MIPTEFHRISGISEKFGEKIAGIPAISMVRTSTVSQLLEFQPFRRFQLTVPTL
jgi:hypothetical protein